MAGPYTPSFTFRQRGSSNTTVISGYTAGGDAVGYIYPVTSQTVATSAMQGTFVLPEGVWDLVYISGKPDTGGIRFWANGSPGPVALDIATAKSQLGAATGVSFGGFRGGRLYKYSIVVEVALEA